MDQVVEYNVTDAAISDMRTRYMALTIKGLDDMKGLAEVHEARMVVRGKRIEVEKKRKELKADALAWSQKVDSEARRITKALEPIETHLTTEEEKITKEKERIKAEEERKRNEEAQDRVYKMAAWGVSMPFAEALNISKGEFDAKLIIAEDEYKKEQMRLVEAAQKEQERIAAERKAREEEAAKLASERAELDRIRAEEAKKRAEEEAKLRAEREKIEAERRAVEDARREQEHREALERAKKEAAERAIIEAKERAEREARERAEVEAQAKKEAERQERLKPDKEKLKAFADSLITLKQPEGDMSADAQWILSEALKKIQATYKYIIKASKEL